MWLTGRSGAAGHPIAPRRDDGTEHHPDVTATGLAAGFHAVAELPAPNDEQHLIAVAEARSVGLYGLSPCRATAPPTTPPTTEPSTTTPVQLVLGFGNVGERAITAGIAAVGDLLRGRVLSPPPAA
ncbi:hypothetical protein ACTPOK_01125 [Streptomyces inhibens]|uniref:hypothetical protein n=1 Tax=Streptomyces inhibens TaxID=2293571 RepID=UPI00402A9A03